MGIDSTFGQQPLIWAILGILAAESALMVRLTRGRPIEARLQWVTNSLAGMFLVLALLAVLRGASSAWFLATLAGALLAHLADFWLRWRLMPKAAPEP